MRFSCPTCNELMQAPDESAGRKATCPKCGQKILIPLLPYNPARKNETKLGKLEESISETPITHPSEPTPIATSVPPTKSPPAGTSNLHRRPPDPNHSGLGIASFIIAVLVVGLDVILGLIVAFGAAFNDGRRMRGEENILVSGIMTLICVACMSAPLCLIGVGLGVTGVVAHKKSNNFFSWIGLISNATLIICVVIVFVVSYVFRRPHH